jgi:outer membrane lipoprotein-sorting protein
LIRFCVFSVLICLSTSVFAKADALQLLKKIDELYRSQGSKALMQMQVITPNWTRTIKMDIWTKGLDYTFVRILEPRKDRGVSSLKRKNEMWNFFPKINKVIKVPPSMMMGSWMGSDFTNDDLIKNSSFEKDYDYLISKETAGFYYITLTPKKNTVSLWGKIVFDVNKKSLLPSKQSYYDEKGVKVRELLFKDVQKIDGKNLPVTMELIPLTKDKVGYKTVVKYLKLKFDIKISDRIFSRTNLQKRQ